MNIRKFGLVTVLVAAIGAAACASTRTQQAAGEAIDDSVITSRIAAALVADPQTKERQIEVETYRGVVQLSGYADTSVSKSRAAAIALKEKGVTRVDNNLEVRSTNATVGTTIDDSVLTTKVKAALVANPDTKAHQINVETLRGVVQLSGFVDSEKERGKAADVARSVTGVKDVHNELAIKQPAS